MEEKRTKLLAHIRRLRKKYTNGLYRDADYVADLGARKITKLHPTLEYRVLFDMGKGLVLSDDGFYMQKAW